MKIGAILQELLQQKNIKVSELSREINIAPSTIYSIIKRDNMKVDIDVLIKISDALGVSAEYFYDKRKSDKTSDTSLSMDEKELIKKYRQLNADGKRELNIIIDAKLLVQAESQDESENKVR